MFKNKKKAWRCLNLRLSSVINCLQGVRNVTYPALSSPPVKYKVSLPARTFHAELIFLLIYFLLKGFFQDCHLARKYLNHLTLPSRACIWKVRRAKFVNLDLRYIFCSCPLAQTTCLLYLKGGEKTLRRGRTWQNKRSDPFPSAKYRSEFTVWHMALQLSILQLPATLLTSRFLF